MRSDVTKFDLHTDSQLDESNALAFLDDAIANLHLPDRSFARRGIVIPGGGRRYFTCAWICIRMLRELGCTLPIELWHLGPSEMTEEMRTLVAPHNVETVDALEVRKRYPVRRLGGWELKPFAMLHSRFQEVLLLDADNVPILNPSYLFECPEYQQTGAIFWPDYGRLASDRCIWKIVGVDYRDEPEFETGQIVVDKVRSWRALSLTMWFNEHSDFYYSHIHGDKETFHMAWRKLGKDYSMTSFPIESLPGVMCQYDFKGERVFQHRNLAKWSLYGINPRIPGFLLDHRCRIFLEELKTSWHEEQMRRNAGFAIFNAADQEIISLAEELCQSRWLYERVGFDNRAMSFATDGRILEGQAECERSWTLHRRKAEVILQIWASDEITALLQWKMDRWSGAWQRYEKMEVRLTKLPT